MLQTVVNTAYCCLILLAKLIQKIVFGELRVVEKQVNNKIQKIMFGELRVVEKQVNRQFNYIFHAYG